MAVRNRTADEWETVLLKAGVPAVRADGISHSDFMLNSPQVRENGMAVEDEIPGIGRFWRSAACVEFSGLSSRTASPTPMGGAAGDLLSELGYTERQIDELSEKGVTKGVGHGLPTG